MTAKLARSRAGTAQACSSMLGVAVRRPRSSAVVRSAMLYPRSRCDARRRDPDRLAARRAALLPRRPRRLRLLVLLGLRPADAARGPLVHGATSWKDYFRVNTDHKVIGIQYVCTSFFFLFVGGLLAMLMRAELAAPGMQFVDANTSTGSSASTPR